MNTIDSKLTNYNVAATMPAASAQKAPAQQQNPATRQAGGTSGPVGITPKSDTGQTAAAGGNGLAPAYTVEISKEGAALSAAATASAAGSSAAPESTSATDQTTAAAATSQTANTAATASETTSGTNTSDLSAYTDSQLQQLLSNGKISRTEYDSEIAKREASQAKGNDSSVAAAST
jgi:hypothetical protein